MLQAEGGSVRVSQTLMNLGVDSLIAAEIRSWFLKELDVDIPVLNILNTASIAHLCREATSRLERLHQEKESEVDEAAVPIEVRQNIFKASPWLLPANCGQPTPAEGETRAESSDGSVTDETASEISQLGSSLLEENMDDTSRCTSVGGDEGQPSIQSRS